jgi:predicted RND superfamily exporter protein
VALLTLVVPAWLVSRARIDNSVEVWLGREEGRSQYRDFLARYGNDEMIVIAAATREPLGGAVAAAQVELSNSLRKLDGIRDAISLPETVASLAMLDPQVRQRPQDHPLVRNLLLSHDGSTVGVVAWLAPLSGPEARRALVSAVRDAASKAFGPRHMEPHVVGAPVMNVALDSESSREARILLPVAGCFAAVALVVLLRSVAAAAACLLATGATVLWTAGIMVACKLTFNMISVALPAILVVLALAPGIHIASHFLSHSAAPIDPAAAMRDALHDLTLPIVMTTVTTSAGFASLMVADMRPVFEVGLFAAVGMLLSLLFNMLIVPGLLMRFPPRVTTTAADNRRWPWLGVLGRSFARWRWTGVLASLLLTAACAGATTLVRTESNVLNFFPTDSRIARDYRFVSERLTGLYTLELDLAAPAADGTRTLQALSTIAEHLCERPDVARVDHYGVFQSVLDRAGSLSTAPLTSYLAGAATEPLRRAASRFRVVADDVVHLRASVLVRSMSSHDFYSLVDRVREQASSLVPPSVKWNLTGAVLLLNDSQTALVRTQVGSFATASGTVLLMITLLFRSPRVLAVAIIPNLLPVLATFSLMALLDIPIDPATVMIASVAIGLTDDSTVHFLTCYRHAKTGRDSGGAAAGSALQQAGRPIITAATVAVAGFAILYVSQFRPLAHFGLLTGATLVTAVACHLTFTPAWAAAMRLWEDS